MGFWIKVVKKEPRAKRVSTAYPFYPFTRFMHRLLNDFEIWSYLKIVDFTLLLEMENDYLVYAD